MRKSAAMILAIPLFACFKYVPLAPSPVRQAAPVAAGFDKTWESVITYFADRNISIRTIEKASGIIVAETARANLINRTPVLDARGNVRLDEWRRPIQSPPLYADCRATNGYGYDPTLATYNIRVLGDSTKSSVQVNVRYTSSGAELATVECSSTGRWEEEVEAFIKRSAEGTHGKVNR